MRAVAKKAYLLQLPGSWVLLSAVRAVSRVTQFFSSTLLLSGILAQLDKLTHAKRVKSGDAVTAHLVASAKLPDGRELQKGTMLVGTITDVKAKADKKDPSKMGLLFTTAAPKDGKEMTVSMVLVTVAPHLQQNDDNLLAAGNPFSGQNRMQAGTATNTLNSVATKERR